MWMKGQQLPNNWRITCLQLATCPQAKLPPVIYNSYPQDLRSPCGVFLGKFGMYSGKSRYFRSVFRIFAIMQRRMLEPRHGSLRKRL